MEQNFWTARWAEGQTGWHASQPNPFLLDHLGHLECEPDDALLVPLSGKSLDLEWLRRKARLRPIGVEWAEKAVAETFAEAQLEPSRRSLDEQVELWWADGIAVLCADWFAVGAEHLAAAADSVGARRPLQTWWDRAALIALPAEVRPRYAEHLLGLLPSRARGLLLAIEYPEGQIPGPPFSVDPLEVRRHFTPACDLMEVAFEDALAASPKRQAQGVTRLDERLYLLKKQ